MVHIERVDDEVNARTLVNYFARKYRATYDRKYGVVYARDCTLMGRVLYKFEKANQNVRLIHELIDKTFEEYHNRVRAEEIDIKFVLHMTDFFLKNPNTKKMPPPPVSLGKDLKDWLKKEKEKWNL